MSVGLFHIFVGGGGVVFNFTAVTLFVDFEANYIFLYVESIFSSIKKVVV